MHKLTYIEGAKVLADLVDVFKGSGSFIKIIREEHREINCGDFNIINRHINATVIRVLGEEG